MKNRKILIIANDFTTIYHFRMELLEHLIAEKYAVVVAIPDDERNSRISSIGCVITPIPISRFGTNPIKDFETFLAIRKVICKENPSFVFTYTAKPNIYGGIASSLKKIPYVCTVTGLGVNFAEENFISRVMLNLQRIAFKKAKKIFFQNSSNRELFNQHGIALNNGDIVAGSGVNLEKNSFVRYPANNPVKFLTAARIRQDKGYDELFAAIRRCKINGVSAEFSIVGWYEDNSYKEIVEKMQKEYNVVFYSYISHEKIHDVMAEYDCLIQPSHHEGMSNVILEAAATGRPAIVSNIPGCKEGVDDNITGYYFTVKDIDSLYDRICRFVDLSTEERRTMGKRAREKMERQFDRKAVVSKYMDEIKSLQED